jgi:4-amino-4-deoxy-L-arabinose transferase-like glycosyltransferase
VWLIATLVVAAALGAARALHGFPGFSMTGDALLYGDLARSLAAGEGFVSSFVYPISLAYPALATLPQPHFLYHPAYPALLAPGVALGGARDAVLLGVNVALAWALLPLTFVLARRLYGREAAWLATALLALDTTVASNVRNAGTELLTMLVALAAAALLVEAPGAGRAFAAGVVLGVGYLVRPNLAVLVVPAALHLWRLGAATRVAPLALGALAVAAPWLVRGWLVTGQPGFSLYLVANLAFETTTFPGTMATYGELVPRGPVMMLTQYPGELADKVARLAVYYVRQVWFTVNPLVMLAFVAALVTRAGPRAALRLADFTATGLVLTMATVIAIAAEPRYLAPFAPLVIVLGAGFAVETVRRVPGARRRWALVALATILLALPVTRTVQDLLRAAPARWRDPNLAAVATLTTPADVIVTDIGRGVTWYAARRTVQAPPDAAVLAQVDARLPVSAIYLSARAPEAWPRMYGRPLPADYAPPAFVLVRAFPDGARLYRRPARGG